MKSKKARQITERRTPVSELRYRMILKALRKRAGVRAAECAEAMGLRGPTGYLRYENDTLYDTQRIPYRVVQSISKLLVGRGIPPVTLSELVAISEAGQLGSVVEAMKQSTPLPPHAPADLKNGELGRSKPEVTYLQTQGLVLLVRYRLEMGHYFDPSRQNRAAHRTSPLMPIRSFPRDKQWSVRIEDDHATRLGIAPGSYFHCVDTDVAPEGWAVAGRLYPVQRTAKGGLCENLLAVVEDFRNNETVIASHPDEPQHFEARLLGVPIVMYAMLVDIT